MSNFFNIKKLLADTKKVLTIALCGILLISNIAFFTFLDIAFVMPGFLAIIISNILSVIITFLIYKPISKVIDEEIQSRLSGEVSAQRQILEEKNELESQLKFLEDKARERELVIKRLESELDTAKQYKSISNNENMVLKLETSEYEREGYVVKQENVRSTFHGQDIKKSMMLNPFGSDKGDQKVLYIKRHHEKAIIGIDLENVRFCRHNGQIYLEGIQMNWLNNDMCPRDNCDNYGESINICEILNTKNSGNEIIGINNDSKYDDFKIWYSKDQDEIFRRNFDAEVRSKCQKYTSILRQNLMMKFPSLQFLDSRIEQVDELNGEKIYQLKLNKDFDILEVSSSIIMIANTMNQTMPIARS